MNKKAKAFHNKLALITGAGSGIGRATALKFAALGARLILCDISLKSLQETEKLLLAKNNAPTLKVLDVSSWQAMQSLAQEIHDEFGSVEILVNNAGVATSGDFLSTPIDDWNWVIGINLMGVVHGCKAFAPFMVADKRGHIVNLASAAGYYAAPDMSAYSASKHAVMGLTESLRIEMAEHKVGVSAICPGVINTNIVKTMRANGAVAKSHDKIANIYVKRNYGPEHVAEAIVNAIVNNRAVVPVSPEAWALYAGKRLVPSTMDTLQRSWLFRKLKP